MAGEWDADDLVALFELLLRNAERGRRAPPDAPPRSSTRGRGSNRRNGLLRARRNIAYHYDLGNDLFALMLDETMTYSCAVFEDDDEPLADAQRAQAPAGLRASSQLGPDDHVLEIGCGWGGFALARRAASTAAASPG